MSARPSVASRRGSEFSAVSLSSKRAASFSMQWTTRKYYRISTTRCTISALSCVLLLGISPHAVANDLTNDVSFIRAQLETLLADLNSGVSELSGDIVGNGNILNNYLVPLLPLVQGQGNTLSIVLDALNGTSSSSIANRLQDLQYMINGAGGLYQYENIFGYLNEIAQNTANSGGVTNIYNVQVDARDILAGNPWWATNSAFALTFNQYSRTYPSEYPNTGTTYSFPQFLSRWSAMMTLPGNGQGQIGINTLRRDWWRYFGSLSRTADAGDSYPYTWFDWMADATRSNWVLQASAINSSATDVDYIVNHLDLLLDALSSSESVAYSNYVASSSNYVASSSNLVLVSQSVTNTQLVEFAQEEYTDDVLPSTNGLASLRLSEGSIDGNPFETFEDNLESLIPSFGRGSPNMVVIPEMTIGGVHVPIGQADFLSLSSGTRSNPNPVPALMAFIGGFCRWLWRFCCFVGIFFIVKQEWNFWSTLGGSASD